MLAIIIVGCISLGAIAWLLSKDFRMTLKRQAIAQRPFPTHWRKILKKRMPYFRFIPAHLQLQLKKRIKIFIAEKEFVGCDGLVITDEIRVTIAAQACLLLLNNHRGYYPNLKQILVYPRAFIVNNERRNHFGLVWEERSTLSGESWELGKVVLSWRDTLAGASDPFDGNNVVIHEFAHQLDQELGEANGAPQLDSSADYQSWSAVLSKEYDNLRHCRDLGEESLFSYYGATNPAEFFAVITEVFFEQPLQMAQGYPALYSELSRYYLLDPINWYQDNQGI